MRLSDVMLGFNLAQRSERRNKLQPLSRMAAHEHDSKTVAPSSLHVSIPLSLHAIKGKSAQSWFLSKLNANSIDAAKASELVHMSRAKETCKTMDSNSLSRLQPKIWEHVGAVSPTSSGRCSDATSAVDRAQLSRKREKGIS